ncbi:MAG: metalloregulator ArsR/SmtB family transcription factor [Pirellulales bacterium]
MIQNSQHDPLRVIKDETEFDVCADRLKALAEPIRLRIVSLLLEGAKTVGEIAAGLDEDVVKTSHHLGILRTAKILAAAKEGRFVRYALDPEVVRLGKTFFAGQIDLGCCQVRLEKVDEEIA